MYFLKIFNVINLNKGNTRGKSTLQASAKTGGRLSLLKHKDELEFRAIFAATWAAKLPALRTQTKEHERKDIHRGRY